jgi:hypothetical protein
MFVLLIGMFVLYNSPTDILYKNYCILPRSALYYPRYQGAGLRPSRASPLFFSSRSTNMSLSHRFMLPPTREAAPIPMRAKWRLSDVIRDHFPSAGTFSDEVLELAFNTWLAQSTPDEPESAFLAFLPAAPPA